MGVRPGRGAAAHAAGRRRPLGQQPNAQARRSLPARRLDIKQGQA